MDTQDDETIALLHAQLAYVEGALVDRPMLSADDRQRTFYTYLKTIQGNGIAEAKPLPGYPAARVDLGWLKAKAERAVTDLLKTHGPHYVARIIELVIDGSVQRLKFLAVFPNSEADLIDVRFRTADDRGYYEYGFLVILPAGSSQGDVPSQRSAAP